MRTHRIIWGLMCLCIFPGTGVVHGQFSGTIVAWGPNYYGECNVPAPNEDFSAVAAGSCHSLGLKSDRTVVAWGRNEYGQCSVPIPNEQFMAIAAGGSHSLGLKSDGTIVAWGDNYDGQCNVPSPNKDFMVIAAGVYHSLGLKSDGKIVAWGANYHGQCNVPTPNEGFVAIAAGLNHSLGLKSDSTIVAWGDNWYGQCNVPAPNEGFVAIAADSSHSLGLKSDGTIIAWGGNDHGQCNVPTPNKGFTAVAAGRLHSLGLRIAPPVIGFDPDEIIFSDTLIAGATAQQTLNVLNNGGDTLEVTSVVATEAAFSVSSSSFTVSPGSSIVIDVQFAPATAGTYNGWLIFNSNDPINSVDSVYCQGRAMDYIYLSIPTTSAFPGDTILVPVQTKLLPGKAYDSAELAFGGYQGGLQFIEIDTAFSLIGKAGWTCTVNETDSLLLTAYAGAKDISGEGVFCWLKFIINGDIGTWIPITIEFALFNTGEDSVITTDGSVQIRPIPFYGDVDENDRVQAHDAAFILKYVVGTIDTLTCQQFANADVTLDSTVSALDASTILKYVVMLIDTLPYPGGPLLANGEIAMEDAEIVTGQIVEIPLYVTSGDNILSFEGTVEYNPDHLILTDVVWPSTLAGYTILDADYSGKIRFSGAGTNPSITEGVLAKLRFTVKEGFHENETVVKLQNLRWNENGVLQNVAQAKLSIVTDLNEHNSQRPADFVLEQNYPNPFNPTTTIGYAIPYRIKVNLSIYDVRGREIFTLFNESQGQGWYQVQWDGVSSSGQRVSSGVYLVQLKAGNFVDTKKIILIK